MRIIVTPALWTGRTESESYPLADYVKSQCEPDSYWGASTPAQVIGRLIDTLAAKEVLSAAEIMVIVGKPESQATLLEDET